MADGSLWTALYLGAHLDDVVLSCGGQIAQTTAVGGRVLVATMMAGDPPSGAFSAYAQGLHERWALAQEVVAVRRAEDVAACGLLGAEVWHGRVPDCIYRLNPATGETFYNADGEIFGVVAPDELDESGLLGEITAVLRRLPAAEQVYAPLGVGNHVDHQLVRLAAEQVFGADLLYYEDYPYGQHPHLVDAFWAQESAVGRTWQVQVVGVSHTAVERRCAAILAYASQMSSFFTDEADLQAKVRGYVTAVGGERLWRREEN